MSGTQPFPWSIGNETSPPPALNPTVSGAGSGTGGLGVSSFWQPILQAADPHSVLVDLGLGSIRPVTQFGSYGTADDTRTIQNALDSGEPFFLPYLGRDSSGMAILSKIQQIHLHDKSVMWGLGFQTGFKALTGVNAATIISDQYATSMMVRDILCDGDWTNQANAATGVAHMFQIAGNYQEGVSYADNQVRINQQMGDSDCRHRFDVRVFNAAGAGMYIQGIGASEFRAQIMDCCDGMIMQSFDSELFFDIGGSARNNLSGQGYCGNNRFYGKTWYAGQGSGNSPMMQTKLQAVGIDTTQSFYNVNMVSAARCQMHLQIQDGSAGSLFFQYCYDMSFWGHIEGPADSTYGSGTGRPGSAVIALNDCNNIRIDAVTIGQQGAAAPANAPYLIDFQGANQNCNITLSQRGWTLPAAINGTFLYSNNYLRINGTVYSGLTGKDSLGRVLYGATDTAGHNAGVSLWTGGDPYGLAGTTDLLSFKQWRFNYQDPVSGNFTTCGVIDPTGLSLDGTNGIPIKSPVFVAETNSTLSTYGQLPLGMHLAGGQFIGRIHGGSNSASGSGAPPGQLTDVFALEHHFSYFNLTTSTYSLPFIITGRGIQSQVLAGATICANDAAAATAGYSVGDLYVGTGGVIKIRLT